jgi:hypothetical protein
MKCLKKVSLKFKIAIGVLFGILSLILLAIVGGQMKAKDKLEYELAKLKSEMEIAKLEEETEENLAKIKDLEKQEMTVREKIAALEEEEIQGREVSLEELDQFFKDRGL